MSEYGMCECYACYRRVPKLGARRISIDREKGYSSGSIGFSLRGARFYTGRTYYAKQDVWLCHFCYLARAQQIAQQKKRAVAAAALIVGVLVLAVVLQQSQASNQASAVPARNPTADLVQDSAKQAVPLPYETTVVQNRLIELVARFNQFERNG